MMKQEMSVEKRRTSRLIKASLLKPTNLLVLIVGCLAGKFSLALVPIGITAYGALCWLDVSSHDFAKKVLASGQSPSGQAQLDSPLPQGFQLQAPASIQVPELASLLHDVTQVCQKISREHSSADDAAQQFLGDLSRVEELGMRSKRFLLKAQNLHDYLDTEHLEQIHEGITALQHKIETSKDPFAQQQYQQALTARIQHRQNLKEIQTAYERLVSQVTNISLSLESLHSRMVKINTAGYGSVKIETEHVAQELQEMLQDMEYLESALNEQLSPEPEF